MRDPYRILILIVPALALFLTGCATVYNPATGAKEYIMIGTEQEVSIGNQVAAEIETKYKLSQDAAQIERVNTIGRRIAAVSDRQDLRYYFKVLENKEINALSTPGGYVYVNSGLIEKADDDELAAVLGHEVGHVAARHAVQAMQSNMGASLLASLVFSQVKTTEQVRQAAAVGLNLIMLGYSRGDEFEADKLGVRYAYYAGFDPNGEVTFLEKLQQQEKGNSADKAPVYLSSHPLYSDRIAKAGAYAAYLKETHGQPPVRSPAPAKQ
jgi:predicted Zn-dependent protease